MKLSMSNKEFFKEHNRNLRECLDILEKYCGQIELVSYGLAPNPTGFCYEVLDNNYGPVDYKELDRCLGSLNTEQENLIKELYL